MRMIRAVGQVIHLIERGGIYEVISAADGWMDGTIDTVSLNRGHNSLIS